MKKIPYLFLIFIFFLLPTRVFAVDWAQDAGNAQRTGFTNEDPKTPWTFAWKWNASDSQGGISCTNNDPKTGHCYTAPRESRTVSGGGYLFVPAGSWGFYALNLNDGSVAWRNNSTSFTATPAYDGGYVYAATDAGMIYKFSASSGQVAASFNTNATITKALLIADTTVFVVTDNSRLISLRTSDLGKNWEYGATGSPKAGTPAAYSASKNLLIFASDDLYVHAVNKVDGSLKWRVKPTPRNAGYPFEFSYGHPVIAEDHNLVFVRLNIGIDAIFGPGTWPTTLTAIRNKLTQETQWKNLFPLNLDTGSEVFVAPVGPGGTEDLVNNAPNLRMQNMPVVKKTSDGKEVAYLTWRNNIAAPPDPRWDGHMGEMVLDSNSVSGYTTGDIRFVKFDGDTVKIIDEWTPLTMAANTLFYSHWSSAQSATITDRSASKGSYTTPILTTRNPFVVRSTACSCSTGFSSTHYSPTCPVVYDHGSATPTSCSGRWFGSGNFYNYYLKLDPPTPARSAYSDGIRPRYTYVSNGKIIVEGNGGDIMVLRHSGSVQPTIAPTSTPAQSTPTKTPTPSPTLTTAPSATVTTTQCLADFNNDLRVDLLDYSILVANFLKSVISNPKTDINKDGFVDLTDYSLFVSRFLKPCA